MDVSLLASVWSSSAQVAISDMETKHRITISTTIGHTRSTTATSINEFRVQVAIPYFDALVSNINIYTIDTSRRVRSML